MFGVLARTIQYAGFFAKLTAHHVVVDEFDWSTNCACTTVVETGFPGNRECLEVAQAPKHVDHSDVTFDEERVAAPPAPPESDLPDVARKGKI